MAVAAQADEVGRLNGVYNKLLTNAGVEMLGEHMLAADVSHLNQCFADLNGLGGPAEGRGRVVNEHTVEVELSTGGKRRLTTKNILIATGGSAVKADIPGSVTFLLGPSCNFHTTLLTNWVLTLFAMVCTHSISRYAIAAPAPGSPS